MSIDPTWFVATGEDDGNVLIFRIRDTAPEYATNETFAKLLAITWEFDPTCNNGLPLPEDLERMQELENLLEPMLSNERQAFLTGVVTGNGVREWQWYAKDAQEVMRLVNRTLGELAPFPVQFVFQDDPAWEAWTRFRDIPAHEPEQADSEWCGGGGI